MSFADVLSKINVSLFSTADKATILSAMEKIYEESDIGRAMIDNWIKPAVGFPNGREIIIRPGDPAAYPEQFKGVRDIWFSDPITAIT